MEVPTRRKDKRLSKSRWDQNACACMKLLRKCCCQWFRLAPSLTLLFLSAAAFTAEISLNLSDCFCCATPPRRVVTSRLKGIHSCPMSVLKVVARCSNKQPIHWIVYAHLCLIRLCWKFVSRWAGCGSLQHFKVLILICPPLDVSQGYKVQSLRK